MISSADCLQSIRLPIVLPNDVSSLATDHARMIAPFSFLGYPEKAMEILVWVCRQIERSRIIEAGEKHAIVEFRSRIFKFRDLTIFCLVLEVGLVHLRSQAQAGWWDLGVNHRRMEHLRSLFSASQCSLRP